MHDEPLPCAAGQLVIVGVKRTTGTPRQPYSPSCKDPSVPAAEATKKVYLCG